MFPLASQHSNMNEKYFPLKTLKGAILNTQDIVVETFVHETLFITSVNKV